MSNIIGYGVSKCSMCFDTLIYGVTMRVDEDIFHGLGGTVVAFSVPDTLLSWGEKWLFAVFVAITSSVASKIISEVWSRVRK